MKDTLIAALPKIIGMYPGVNPRIISGALWEAYMQLETVDNPTANDWVRLSENIGLLMARASSVFNRNEIELFDVIVWTELLKSRYDEAFWGQPWARFLSDMGVYQYGIDKHIAEETELGKVLYAAYDEETRNAWSGILNGWARVDKRLPK